MTTPLRTRRDSRRGLIAAAALLAGVLVAAAAAAAKVPKVPKVPGPDLAAEARAAPVAPPPQTEPIAEPASTRAGLALVFAEIGLDDFIASFPLLLAAPDPGEPGAPRADLDPRAWIAFHAGRIAFMTTMTQQDGLGPHYDATACARCHALPAVGGAGFGDDQGATLHVPPWTRGQAAVVRRASSAAFGLERAIGKTGRLLAPSLYGIGYLDEVPEAVRAALEDPDDRDGDGIRGRRGVVPLPLPPTPTEADYARAERGTPARFGAKAHSRDLEHAVADELHLRMGLTTAVRDDARADLDRVADPEVRRDGVARLAAYVRGLERPASMPLMGVAALGAQTFERVGCGGCHKAKLGALEGAYTDTLLHDMGPGLAGPGLGLAGAGEAGRRLWRTPPLWGLRYRERMLHDGRAANVAEAIAAHDGEAKAARDAYRKLSPRDRDGLLLFLQTR